MCYGYAALGLTSENYMALEKEEGAHPVRRSAGWATAKFPYAVRQQTGMAAVRVHGNFLVAHPGPHVDIDNNRALCYCPNQRFYGVTCARLTRQRDL